MLTPDQFELALKKDRQHLFERNPVANELYPQGQMAVRGKSKRDELWEAKRRQREHGVVNEFSAAPPTVEPIINPLYNKPTFSPDQLQQNFGIKRDNVEQEFARPEVGGIQQYNAGQGFAPQVESRVIPQPVPHQQVVQQSPQPVEQYSALPVQRVDVQTDKRRQYLEELRQQVALKEQKAKEEKYNRIMKERADLLAYQANNPFGKEGSGAPLRDQFGNIISAKRKNLMLNQQPINYQVPPTNNLYPSYDALHPPNRQFIPNYPQEQNAYVPSYSPQVYSTPVIEQYQAPIQNPYDARPPLVDFKASPEPVAFRQPVNYIEDNAPIPQFPQAPQVIQANVNPSAPTFITREYDPEKETEKRQKAMEMQRALEEQMRQRKEIKEKEKQTRELREKLEEERIIRERLEIEEKYKQEEELKRKKIEDVRAENFALAEAKKRQRNEEKRRVSEVPEVQNAVQMVTKETKRRIKDELFGGENPSSRSEKDIPSTPREKRFKERSIQAFNSEPEVNVIERQVTRNTPKEHIDVVGQTRVINEISEKLKDNINGQLEILKAQMEQQQKYLMGELNNLKVETKEALNQKALAQNELTQLKSELEARKHVESRYEQEITNALNKNYDAKSRPTSKDRALMSRGENNKEMKNYQKMFFDNYNGSAMKLYDKSGETISATSSLALPDQSLKGDTKIIQLGCIDPNKSLYMADSTTSVKHFKKNPAEASLLMNSNKAVDTLDFLDRIAGVPRDDNPLIPVDSKNYPKDHSSNEDRLKMPKYVPNPKYSVGSSIQSGSEGLSSLKLQELNKLNNQRLDELTAIGTPGDEMEKLDNLLLDIIQNKTDSKKNLRELDRSRTGPLNAIDEMELEDSLKENNGSSQPQSITTANLNLPTLKDYM